MGRRKIRRTLDLLTSPALKKKREKKIQVREELITMDSLPGMDGGVDPEVAQFIQAEQQRAELQAQAHKLADVCWEQCVDRPKDKLDSRTETCVSNCVERFIDTSLTVAQRFQKLIQQQAGMS